MVTVIKTSEKYNTYPFGSYSNGDYSALWNKIHDTVNNKYLLGFEPTNSFDKYWTGSSYNMGEPYYRWQNCLSSTSNGDYIIPKFEPSTNLPVGYDKERVCVTIDDVFKKEFFELKNSYSVICPNNKTAGKNLLLSLLSLLSFL